MYNSDSSTIGLFLPGRKRRSSRRFWAQFVLLAAAWLGLLPDAAAQVPAFPGALGFGAGASGGRNGAVYHVTTRADSGPGSFRDAVSQSNRIVVFDVGGYITLSSEVAVRSDITIAGQTAPGGGIAIRGREVSFGSRDNIICRFVRFRPGSDSNRTDNGLNLYRARNVILDHVSISFAKWNNIGGVSDDWQAHPVTDITVQNCVISNPIGQQFGAHTECVNGNWSWFYNLFANSHNRNPLAKFNTVFINNVNYNYQGGYTTHTSTSFKHDIVNNYFIGGPGSGGSDNTWFQIDRNQSIYYAGNIKDRNLDGILNGAITTPYWYQGEGTVLRTPWSSWSTTAPVYSPATAFAHVVSQAGALPRDEMDALLISQVRTLGDGPVGTGAGTAGPAGGLYSSQTQTGLRDSGFGTIVSGTAPLDSDGDAMPDAYELDTGSDPQVDDHAVPVSPDAFIPASPAGYTRLDEYLHFLAGPRVTLPMNMTARVDLRDVAPGFVGSQTTFQVEDSDRIDATLQPDGYTVALSPGSNYLGRARFSFQVNNGSGAVMTQDVLVMVSGALGLPPPPTNLTATVISSSEIDLTWTDQSPNEAGFTIERSPDGVDFGELATVAAGVTRFADVVSPGSTFHYRVLAINPTGASAHSNVASATTPSGTPAAPTWLEAVPSNSRIRLDWSASPGASGYRVKRSLTHGGAYATLDRTTDMGLDDAHTVNGTTYFYVVTALNHIGESGPSPQAGATPSSTVTYPAEDETYGTDAVFEASNGGFHDTGYVNFAPTVGSYLVFEGVDAGGGGRVTLQFRYALGNADRTGRLIVNGRGSGITFTGTGTWTTWAVHNAQATLAPGTENTIRLESTGMDLANIDELTIIGSPVTPPPAAPLIGSVEPATQGLFMEGFGGMPGDAYVVLSATNLAHPLAEWIPMTTNHLDGNGVFALTNAVDPSIPHQFYRLQMP